MPRPGARRSTVRTRLGLRELVVRRQPDDTTCGPTCLDAVYRYYDDPLPLEQVIAEVDLLETGGTLGVLLGCHALGRGYEATVYTYNLHVFDPTWFPGTAETLIPRLEAQLEVKPDPRLATASRAYIRFLEAGGRIRFRELQPALIQRYLDRGIPILTGLSATYLYGCSREFGEEYDDVAGTPVGHFVVLGGYEKRGRKVVVADPLHDNPRFETGSYKVGMNRLIGAILLGIVTYDANLLVITPSRRR
jgi:hypothetical protein